MTFSYTDFINNSTNNSGDGNNRIKIGYFKLGENEECLVRFNISKLEDLQFNSVHKAIFGQRIAGLNGFAGISCLNKLGSHENVCPLCQAAANGHPVIDKAKQTVFVPMLVAYKDMATGGWAAPVPMIWERPASFAKELASQLANYGNLRDVILRIQRTGTRKETRYSMSYALPTIIPENTIPKDFSAFDTLDLAKHSFWVKTAEEMNTYLTTGSFPTVDKAPMPTDAQAIPTPAPNSVFTASVPTTNIGEGQLTPPWEVTTTPLATTTPNTPPVINPVRQFDVPATSGTVPNIPTGFQPKF